MTIRQNLAVSLLALGVATLAGCSSAPQDISPAPAPAPHPPVMQTPVPSNPAPAQTPAAPQFKPVSSDQCGADALQYLVGKPRTDIPVPLDPGKRRVVCSSCVITMDYSADRQTIVFDTDTGLIQSVKCG